MPATMGDNVWHRYWEDVLKGEKPVDGSIPLLLPFFATLYTDYERFHKRGDSILIPERGSQSAQSIVSVQDFKHAMDAYEETLQSSMTNMQDITFAGDAEYAKNKIKKIQNFRVTLSDGLRGDPNRDYRRRILAKTLTTFRDFVRYAEGMKLRDLYDAIQAPQTEKRAEEFQYVRDLETTLQRETSRSDPAQGLLQCAYCFDLQKDMEQRKKGEIPTVFHCGNHFSIFYTPKCAEVRRQAFAWDTFQLLKTSTEQTFCNGVCGGRDRVFGGSRRCHHVCPAVFLNMPRWNGICNLNPQTLLACDQLWREQKEVDTKGPLHGRGRYRWQTDCRSMMMNTHCQSFIQTLPQNRPQSPLPFAIATATTVAMPSMPTYMSQPDGSAVNPMRKVQ